MQPIAHEEFPDEPIPTTITNLDRLQDFLDFKDSLITKAPKVQVILHGHHTANTGHVWA